MRFCKCEARNAFLPREIISAAFRLWLASYSAVRTRGPQAAARQQDSSAQPPANADIVGADMTAAPQAQSRETRNPPRPRDLPLRAGAVKGGSGKNPWNIWNKYFQQRQRLSAQSNEVSSCHLISPLR